MRIACALVLLATAAPLAAADPSLSVTKGFAVVSDLLGTVRPRIYPGSVVDYTLTVTNPVLDITTTVLGVTVTTSPYTFTAPTITDTVAPNLALRVTDLAAAGKGPVEFSDGGLLGLGSSGVGYTFTSLGSTTDGLAFFDGATWSYVPRPDAQGYDPKVRAIRVTLTGTKVSGSGSFRLRYRTVVR